MRKSKVKRSDVRAVLGSNNEARIQIWALEKAPPPAKTADANDDDRVMLPLRHILKLCNHYDLSLSDFIENAEEPPVSRRRGQREGRDGDVSAVRLELLQQRIDHVQELRLVRETAAANEAKIRQDCEQQLLKQERLMQQTIDAQREIITDLRKTLEELRGEETKKDGDYHPYQVIAADDRG